MENLWKKIDEYVVQNKMLTDSDAIMAAVSGGMDSMCMLNYLLDRRETLGFKLAVFHFNHHIREEAGADAEFVSEFCKMQNIPVYVREGDVEKEATNRGLTIEEAARQMRYNAMFDCAKKFEEDITKGVDTPCKVALAFAHNAGDQAETILFRLFRGTGLKGIRGIEPVSGRNGFTIIRPLLECSRENIEICMKKSSSGWVDDRTNQSDDYSRNKIRHHIIDYAVKNLNRRAIENVCRAACDVSQAYEYIQKKTNEAYDTCLVDYYGKKALNIQRFKLYDAYLQKQTLLLHLEKKTVARKDLTAEHIDLLLELIYSKKNGRLDLPYGLKAIKVYDYFYLDDESRIENSQDIAKSLERENSDENQREDLIEQKLIKYSEGMDIPASTYTKWLDYDKIQNRVEIRTRREGDYLYINDIGNKISLKKYFINEKIPQQLRDKILLVTDGSHVLWVVGYRISAGVKITHDTKHVLELKYREEKR